MQSPRFPPRGRAALTRIARVVTSVVAMTVLSSCGPFVSRPAPPPSPADSIVARSRLNAGLVEYFTFALAETSELVTASGLRPNALPLSAREVGRQATQLEQRVGRLLDRTNSNALTPGEYLTLLSLRWELTSRAEATAFYWTDFSELAPPTTPLRGLIETIRRNPFAEIGGPERYLFFLDAIPLTLERMQAGLLEREQRGYFAPRETVESAISFLARLQSLGPAAPWQVDTSRAAGVDTALVARFTEESRTSVEQRVVPAIDSFVRFLRRDYLPKASARVGLWQYPGGREHYRHLLRRYSSLEITSDEAHRVGIAELRRIDSTMATLRDRFGWSGDVAAVRDTLRRMVDALRPNVDAVPEALAEAQQRVEPELPSRFTVALSRAPTLRRASPLEELLWPSGGYTVRNAADSSGVLLITERWGLLSTRASIASLSFRMLRPGSHLRTEHLPRNDTIPPFRRLHVNDGFSEGWSQYAASLAGEMGMYTRPVDAYGRLLDEGFAAALLVVDTGIHHLSWTREQGREFLARYSLDSDATVDSILIEQVINEPGRAGAAILGAREIGAMRGWMQQSLGRDFDLRAWHDQLLSLGAVPLPAVAAHFEWWLYDLERRGRAADAASKAAQDGKPAPRKKVPR